MKKEVCLEEKLERKGTLEKSMLIVHYLGLNQFIQQSDSELNLRETQKVNPMPLFDRSN